MNCTTAQTIALTINIIGATFNTFLIIYNQRNLRKRNDEQQRIKEIKNMKFRAWTAIEHLGIIEAPSLKEAVFIAGEMVGYKKEEMEWPHKLPMGVYVVECAQQKQ